MIKGLHLQYVIHFVSVDYILKYVMKNEVRNYIQYAVLSLSDHNHAIHKYVLYVLLIHANTWTIV